ncbi:unnamed protein product [Ilex paraguariensis]|uniref:Uncharacterized protein n=1 Tax=Ilex paraguariensis TaxID=185542 RepID=A0ABC8UG22_9AQUA
MGHHSCCNKQKVKRGLWSPEEDEKLINYISTNGLGCWSAVPRLAGLQRCGKSCRLRWINYLRPDLKRGSFSPQEAALIIELHRILGNRWAQIAKHLPGRTDNEVKNFWNSSIKKKLIPHGLSDLATFPNLPNPSASYEGLYSLNANPNLISTTQVQQDHQVYIPTPPSMAQVFNQGDMIKMDQYLNYNANLFPVPPSVVPSPLDLSCYDPTWSSLGYHYRPQQFDHQHVFKQEEDMFINNEAVANYTTVVDKLVDPKMATPLYGDDDDDDAVLPMGPVMPKLCEITKGNECNNIPSSSVSQDQVIGPIASLSCFPSGSYPHDHHHVVANQMEYFDAIMSLLPSSSSSSSSSSFSPLSCSQFGMNPTFPSRWDP